jgi:hypothetical protein
MVGSLSVMILRGLGCKHKHVMAWKQYDKTIAFIVKNPIIAAFEKSQNTVWGVKLKNSDCF